MNDRGIIKWLPFESVFNTKDIIKELVSEKEKIPMPILSEDKLEELDYNLKYAFQYKLNILIKYYVNGYVKEKYSKINKIDKQNKKIYLNDIVLSFKQILDIII